MSFAGYMGFVTGIVVGVIFAIARMVYVKKKGPIESDEMTSLIYTRAADRSYWIIAVLTFLVWVADNILRHQRGEEIAVYSSWGIMLVSLVGVYLVSLAYHRWVITGTLFDEDLARKKQAGVILAAVGGMMGPIALSRSSGLADLQPLIIGLAVIASVAGLSLIVTSMRRNHKL